jgi:hypothetical protein
VELFLFITIFVLLAFYVAHGLRFVYTTKWLRVFLGPGVLAANVFRMLACQGTFTKRSETNLWERDGVKFDKGSVAFLSDTVIATTTFLGPFVLLCGINHLLDYPLLIHEDRLPDLLPNVATFRDILDYMLDLDRHALRVYDLIIAAVSDAGATNPAPWAMLYLSVTVMLATAPTKKDLKWLMLGLLVMVVGNRLFGLVGEVGVRDLNARLFAGNPVAQNIWYLCTFMVSVLFGLFLIVILLDVVHKMREVALEPEPTTTETSKSGKKASR